LSRRANLEATQKKQRNWVCSEASDDGYEQYEASGGGIGFGKSLKISFTCTRPKTGHLSDFIHERSLRAKPPLDDLDGSITFGHGLGATHGRSRQGRSFT
jgi:hypothetical protein